MTRSVNYPVVQVRADDLVVERNARHSWRNEGHPVATLITVVNAGA